MLKKSKFPGNNLNDEQIRRLCGLSIFIFYIYTLMISLKLVDLQDGWILGDWLINYSSDFTRRGLPGTIALYISDYFSINIKIIISFFVFILYSIIFLFSWKSLSLQKNIHPYLILLLSPIYFAAVIGMPQLAARKEILWFALISYHTYLIVKNSPRLKSHYFLGLALFPLLILSHEMLFALLPMYLLLHKNQFIKNVSMSLFLYSFSSMVFLIIIFYKTEPSIVQNIYESINLNLTRGSGKVPDNLSHILTAIDALSLDSRDGLNWVLFHINESDYAIKYTIQLLVCILFFYPIHNKILPLLSNKIDLILLIFSGIQFLVIMMVAVDWGRFIYIISFTLFFISLTKNEEVMNVKCKQLTVFFLLIFLLSYRVPLCCGYSSLNPLGAGLYNFITGNHL